MNPRMSAIALALFCGAVHLCAEESGLEDARQKELANICKLWKLSSEKALSDQDLQYVASLMKPDWVGKRLSKWCFYAICKSNSNPEKYYDRFQTSLAYCSSEHGQYLINGIIVGPDPENLPGPILPNDLAQAEQQVWVFVAEYIWRRRFTGRKGEVGVGPQNEDQDLPEILRAAGIPAPCAVPLLATRLGDPNATVKERAWAARAIGNLRRHAGSVEPLLKGFLDPAPEVRSACAVAMGELAHSQYLYTTYDSVGHHPDAPRAVKSLVGLFQDDPAPKVRIAALDGLRTMDREARSAGPALTTAFEKEKNPEISEKILTVIQKFFDPELAPFFLRTMNNPTEDFRIAAVHGLGYLAQAYAEDENWTGRSKFAETVVPELVKSLHDTNAPAVHSAVWALSCFEYDASNAVPALQRLLKGTDENLALSVISTLGIIGPSAKDTVPLIIPWAGKKEASYTVASALGSIGQGGPEVERALLTICDSPDCFSRCHAAYALSQVGASSLEVTKKLESMIQSDPDDSVKEYAAAALARIKKVKLKKERAEDF